MSKLEYLGHKKVSIGNKSSEWIKVDLPCEFWYWSNTEMSDHVQGLKRIKDCNGDIIWRYSTGRGEWLTITGNEEIEICNNVWKDTQKEFREDKLKRILNG
jgi:hypothetical protein